MGMKKALFTTAGMAGLALLVGTANAAMKKQFISIGTGAVTGVYYPTGSAICRLVNKGRKKHGVRCSVESTGGSIDNINTIRTGGLDMGVARSDWQFHAYHGSSKFKSQGAFKELRAVFSVHAEPVSIVARKDSGVKTVDDLVNKRVNIGSPDTGVLASWGVMWGAMGKSNDDLKLAAEMKFAETPSALCDDKIDAFFWLVGNPAALNNEATTKCDAVFASVDNAAIAQLIKEKPFYRWATIPGGMYRGNPKDIKTFGMGTTIVSSTRSSSDTVYAVVKSVFDNLAQFKNLYPAFATLQEGQMIKDALSAPLHNGALKYYKERGWM